VPTLPSFFQSLLPGRRGAVSPRDGKGSGRAAADDLPRCGERLGGKYLLGKRLGEGGMGTVFAATDESLDREVAIKFLQRRGGDGKRLFKELRREAKMLAAASHPNIVQVIEVGTSDRGVPFLVMEHVNGRSLRVLIEQLGPIEVVTAVSLAFQIGRALTHAHQRRVVHADLKPDNVLINIEGKIKVTDFGLARQLERTRAGTTEDFLKGCGTPHYMAPELFRGADPTPASDVYAMGATLVELLTAKGMFQKDSEEIVSREEARRRALHEKPSSVVETCGPLAAALSRLIDGMVAKDPAERPSTKEVTESLRFEHRRLLRHFPGHDEPDPDEDVPPRLSLPDLDEAAPVLSDRVHAFVTAPLPGGFVPGDGLPASFGAHARSAAAAEPRAPASPRTRGTERMAHARPRRQEMTVRIPPGAPAEARPWWKRRQEATDPMPRAQPRQETTARLPPAAPAPKPTSSGSVTFPSDPTPSRGARGDHGERGSGRPRLQAATLAAIGFACLSAGLIGRDLIATLRPGGAPAAPSSEPARSAEVQAPAVTPASSAPAGTAATSVAPSATSLSSPVAVEPKSAPPTVDPAPAPRATTVRAGGPAPQPADSRRDTPADAGGSVVDPWATSRSGKTKPAPASTAPRASAAPAAPPPPNSVLPFGIRGN